MGRMDCNLRPPKKEGRPILRSCTLRLLAIILFIAVVATPTLAQKGPSKDQGGLPPTLVVIDEVRTEVMTQTMPVIGRLVALRAGNVATRIDGRVGILHAEVGDYVKKGAVLAVLDSDRLERELKRRTASVAESKAFLESEKVSLAINEQELRRLESLRKSVAFSKARYEDKQKEVLRSRKHINVAEAALENTRAQLALAWLDIEDTKIRAPYAGVVTIRHTEVGSYVTKGSAVVSMVDDKNLEIEADVPSQRLSGIKSGVVVKVEINNRNNYSAAVRAVVPEENPMTRTRRVRFTPDFGSKEQNFAANQSAIIQLPIGSPRNVLTVHKDAIVKRGGATLVFVVEKGDGDYKAQIRPITTGDAVDNRFEILSGLGPGERVVTRGNERLVPGQKVLFERKS